MIGADDVVRLAVAHFKKDIRGYYTCRLCITPRKKLRDWTVGFEAVAADGHVVGGPIILVVDEESGAVRSLHEAISAGWRSS
jgi:methionine-rich copper-binding protein CopC